MRIVLWPLQTCSPTPTATSWTLFLKELRSNVRAMRRKVISKAKKSSFSWRSRPEKVRNMRSRSRNRVSKKKNSRKFKLLSRKSKNRGTSKKDAKP